MGRLWLALAFIAALAGTAAAKREPACACRTPIILPTPGATGVPTNARFWDIPASGITATPDRRIQVYELAPHTAYELNAPHLIFTTGDGPDVTPPVDPSIGLVSISLDHAGVRGVHFVDVLRIVGTFSTDTAVVRVALTAPSGSTVFYTTPATLSICDLGLKLAPGNVDVAITAIDLAGNESSPVTYNATATVAPDDAPGCYVSPAMRGPCLPFFLIEAWVLGPLVVIFGMVILQAARGRRRRVATLESIALPAVEALARGIRLRAILCFAAIGAGVTIAWPINDLFEIVVLGGPILVIVVFMTAAGWDAATKVLRLASYDGASATVCRDEVCVTVGGQHATMRAAPCRVERAKEAGIPTARI